LLALNIVERWKSLFDRLREQKRVFFGKNIQKTIDCRPKVRYTGFVG